LFRPQTIFRKGIKDPFSQVTKPRMKNSRPTNSMPTTTERVESLAGGAARLVERSMLSPYLFFRRC
jgi:hypothetical protein